jgi:hypothetical protein
MNISFDLSNQLIADTVSAGIDGGIRYWCSGSRRAHHLVVSFLETETGEWLSLTPSDWARALARMALQHPRHFADMISGHGDAATGDVLIQLACFQEVKYG